jgi:hypothetical protein
MLKKTIILIVIVIIGLYFYNYVQLQSQMNKVIKNDSRNNGIKVDVHYANYILTSMLIFNLKSITSDKSKADVFRVFLQFAEQMKNNDFKQLHLAFRGKIKFLLDGKYFKNLGEEYSFQNPVYTMRTFPENLKNPDNSKPYSEWTGGLLGVSQKQIEDFNDFHDKWYFNDLFE